MQYNIPILGGLFIADAAKATLSDAIPALLFCNGVFLLVLCIVLAMVRNSGTSHGKEKLMNKTQRKILVRWSFRHFILGTVAIFLYVGIEVGIPNFINLFLTAAQSVQDGASGMGFDAGAAGTVVGTYWFLMLIGRLLGGALGGKFSAKTQLTFVSLLALVLVVVGIFLPPSIFSYSMPVFKADISFRIAGSSVISGFILYFADFALPLCGESFQSCRKKELVNSQAMGSGIFIGNGWWWWCTSTFTRISSRFNFKLYGIVLGYSCSIGLYALLRIDWL